MSIVQPAAVLSASQTPSWRKWIIALTVSFGAILEVIDTSIVNVALPYIQGNLGATLSEVGWVITGYTVANAIVIPLTAWLGDFFGRKRLWMFSLIGFVLASVWCGLSTTLPMLVAARIVQGLCGGGLLAKAQSILFETFPPHQQGMAQSIFGIGVIVGPVIGPTLGGFLTDQMSWRWIFFVNIPFGILAVVMSLLFLPDMEKNEVSEKVDWLGIFLLIAFLGSFQTVLEQGQQYDWFGSKLITWLSVSATVGFIFFVWRELTTSHPAVDLRVLKYKSLTAGSIYSMILGFGLYGALFAVPIFAQSALNYTAMQTGVLLLPGALASAFMMPWLGRLINMFDSRVLIGSGAVLTAVVMFWLGNLNTQTDWNSLFWPLILRGVATSMMFLPLSMASIGPLPKQVIPAASGMYNLCRQLGGSVGVAAMTTILQQRENLHRTNLISNINIFNPTLQDYINGNTQNFVAQGYDQATAQAMAWRLIDGLINSQAAVMSFADSFWLVGVLFIVTLPLLFFLGKGSAGAKPPEGIH